MDDDFDFTDDGILDVEEGEGLDDIFKDSDFQDPLQPQLPRNNQNSRERPPTNRRYDGRIPPPRIPPPRIPPPRIPPPRIPPPRIPPPRIPPPRIPPPRIPVLNTHNNHNHSSSSTGNMLSTFEHKGKSVSPRLEESTTRKTGKKRKRDEMQVQSFDQNQPFNQNMPGTPLKRRKIKASPENNQNKNQPFNSHTLDTPLKKGKIAWVEEEEEEEEGFFGYDLNNPPENGPASPSSTTSTPTEIKSQFSSDPGEFVVFSKAKRAIINLQIASGLRPKTNMTETAQGDHVSPYILYVQLVSAAINGQESDTVIQSLENIAQACLLHDEKSFKAIKTDFEQSKPHFFQRKDRLQMRKKMEKAPSLQNQASHFDYTARYAGNSWLAQYAAELSSAFLNVLNRNENAIFEKSRAIYEKSGHGATIKTVMNACRALDQLLHIDKTCPNSSKKETAIFNFLNQTNQSENDWFAHLNTKKSRKVYYNINGLNNIENLGSYSIDKPPKKQLSVKRALKICRHLKNDPDKKTWFSREFAEKMADLYDYEYVGVEEDYKTFTFTAARHIVVCFNAFKNISDHIDKENFIEQFVTHLRDNQEWDQLQSFSVEKAVEDIKNHFASPDMMSMQGARRLQNNLQANSQQNTSRKFRKR